MKRNVSRVKTNVEVSMTWYINVTDYMLYIKSLHFLNT